MWSLQVLWVNIWSINIKGWIIIYNFLPWIPRSGYCTSSIVIINKACSVTATGWGAENCALFYNRASKTVFVIVGLNSSLALPKCVAVCDTRFSLVISAWILLVVKLLVVGSFQVGIFGFGGMYPIYGRSVVKRIPGLFSENKSNENLWLLISMRLKKITIKKSWWGTTDDFNSCYPFIWCDL